MTADLHEARRNRRKLAAQIEGPSVGTMAVPLTDSVPAHLLDGGEIVLLAIKPSPWFVPLVSARWLGIAVLLAIAAFVPWLSPIQQWYLMLGSLWCAAARLCWGMVEWASCWYALTNRRVLRARGVFTAELFQCPLAKVTNTLLSMSPAERGARIGTILIQTAGPCGSASWRHIARPHEVHEKLCDAIHRARNRGNNGL